MITYISSATSEQYSILFKEASDVLNLKDTYVSVLITLDDYNKNPGKYYRTDLDEDGDYTVDYTSYTPETFPSGGFYTYDRITSLNEYFAHMESFVSDDKLKKYTILPLDEDTFEVDANARTIKVPDNFVKNGISVKGDEVAEIVYFKIDRYYDATDLYMQDVLIQWKNANGDEGASMPWIKEVIYEGSREYVLVGWPLSSKITGYAGNISFSLRFYKLNDAGTVVYSFSTLTQQAAIKDSLNFNFTNIDLNINFVDDANYLIENRTEDSIIVNNKGLVAAKPVWEKNFFTIAAEENSKMYVLDKTTGLYRSYRASDMEDLLADPSIYLYADIDNFKQDGTRDIDVKAYSPDGGLIVYRWKKTTIPDEDGNAESDKDSTGKDIYVKTKDTSRQPNKSYYTRAKDGNDESGNPLYKYTLYTAKSFPADMSEETGTPLFEKFYSGNLNGVGQYIIVATNKVGNSTTKTKPVECRVIVPEPAPLEIGSIKVKEEGSEILSLNEDGSNKPFQLIASGFTANDTGNNVKSFTWYKDPIQLQFADMTEEEVAALYHQPVPNPSVLVANPTIVKENNSESTVRILSVADPSELEGYYYVEVVNAKNGVSTAPVATSNKVRVTLPAEKMIVTQESKSLIRFSNEDVILKIRAEFKENSTQNEAYRTADDSITYQWYEYKGNIINGEINEVDKAKFLDGTYIPSKKDIKIPVESATSSELILPAEGYVYKNEITGLSGETNLESTGGIFFCIVTNTYNGNSASVSSRTFEVIES